MNLIYVNYCVPIECCHLPLKFTGLHCSPYMDTGNSVESFQSLLGISCKIDNNRNVWSEPYHPAFETNSGICLGYLNVPEVINCTADSMRNPNIKRLCSCTHKGILDYSYITFFYHAVWLRLATHPKGATLL